MKNPTPYLKMRVLGAIDYAEGKTIQDRIRKVAGFIFTDEDANPRKFTHRTISTWLYRYKSTGITGIQNNQRSDKGTTRKMKPEEVMEAINQVLPQFRGGDKKYNRSDIYRACINKGLIHSKQLALTTYFRFIRDYGLLNEDIDNNKKRLAFAMQYANQLWQADTMYGPYVKGPDGKPHSTKLIVFIDDASRVICHGEFFLHENTDSMVNAIKSAFYKRGVPEQLYVDNGAIYTCQEITLICARIGCILRHAPVRDGAAKGKVERFNRTVRTIFLGRALDLSSLAALNRQFTEWVENEYNAKVHSTIGMKPIDRFAFDLKRIRFLEPGEYNDEIFYAESLRKVKKDNTFSFKSIRYEAPADLRNKQIHVRYNRLKTAKVIVYFKNQRMGEAKKLNAIANGLLRRSNKNN
jgi:putative transposase